MVKAFMGYDESVKVQYVVIEKENKAFWVKWMSF